MAFSNRTIWLQSFVALWVVECKLFGRQPTAAFFTFVFPVILFLLFGSIFGENPAWNRPGVRYIDFYAPALIASYIGQAGLTNLTNFLAEYRLLGIFFGRISTTWHSQTLCSQSAFARVLSLRPHRNAGCYIYYFFLSITLGRREYF